MDQGHVISVGDYIISPIIDLSLHKKIICLHLLLYAGASVGEICISISLAIGIGMTRDLFLAHGPRLDNLSHP